MIPNKSICQNDYILYGNSGIFIKNEENMVQALKFRLMVVE